MCGIAGGIRLDTAEKIETDAVGRMRERLAHRGPDSIIRQRKQGFEVPIREWLRDPAWSKLLEFPHLTPYLHRDRLGRLLAEHQAQQIDHSRLLWRLLSLELTFQQVETPIAKPLQMIPKQSW